MTRITTIMYDFFTCAHIQIFLFFYFFLLQKSKATINLISNEIVYGNMRDSLELKTYEKNTFFKRQENVIFYKNNRIQFFLLYEYG